MLSKLDILRGRKQLYLFEPKKNKVRTNRKVIKQGNSLMFSLPSKMAKELNINKDDILEIEILNGQIILTPKGQ